MPSGTQDNDGLDTLGKVLQARKQEHADGLVDLLHDVLLA
jgi:hypothetical protein